MGKKTHEEYLEEVYKLVGDEYTIVGRYQTTHEAIETIHNKCGHRWDISRSNFIKGKRCPKCSLKQRAKKRMKGQEEFEAEMFELVGDEYTVIGEYKGVKKQVNIRHNKCGNEYLITPKTFIYDGSRCRKCWIENKKKTHEEFVKDVYELFGKEYTVLSKYVDSKVDIIVKHNNDCNHTYQVKPYNLLSGKRCVICQKKAVGYAKRKTQEQFESEIYELVGKEYTVMDRVPYVTGKKHVWIRHNSDFCNNHEFPVSPLNFLRGTRCPECRESKGARRIREWLESRNVKFVREYEFEGLVGMGGGNLRYDFAIFNDSDNLQLIIEFDGEFHFRDMTGTLQITKEHDRLKDEYCLKNNIPLLRIPYWDYDSIEELLEYEVLKGEVLVG